MSEQDNLITYEESEAHKNYSGIIACRANIEANFLMTAKLLAENHELSYWKVLGHDSFEDFLGSPEISISRAKAYGLIQLYRLYVEKLDVPKEEIVEIGTTNLLLIAPVVEADKDGWLSKAKTLSKSDLKKELGQGAGHYLPPSSPPPLPPALPTPWVTGYIERVKSSPCCVCDKRPVDPAHFPVTRRAGAPDEWVIPLCRECHGEQHQDPMKWMATYQRKWAKWFYDQICGSGAKKS